jgi:hypothetical protein
MLVVESAKADHAPFVFEKSVDGNARELPA